MNRESAKQRQQQHMEPLVVKADSLRFEEQGLGTVSIEGKRWVLAKEICDVLGIKNPRHAVTRLDDDKCMLVLLQTAGCPQEAYVVNESGAYHLTFIAKKPVAKRFRCWATDEVLPQMRRTGEYRPDAGPRADSGAPRLEISAAYLRLLAGVSGPLGMTFAPAPVDPPHLNLHKMPTPSSFRPLVNHRSLKNDTVR